MIHHLAPADAARDRKRLTELLALRDRIDTEINTLRDTELTRNRADLAAAIVAARQRLNWLTSLQPPARRSRLEPAECGTETGYQRHKYLHRSRSEGQWPLPAGDPCGCRTAHARHEARRTERNQWFAA